MKLARQYHLENNQPEWINFIARQQSYFGNALGLSSNKPLRTQFLPCFASNAHHVSPCFPYHYKLANESNEAYVRRLADELEAKFEELGPQMVIAFFAETSKLKFYWYLKYLFTFSCWCHQWLYSSSTWAFQGNAWSMWSIWCSFYSWWDYVWYASIR